jgi:hypothetical protein
MRLRRTNVWGLVALGLLSLATPASAQGPLAIPYGGDLGETGVSFIDSALPMTQFRIRADTAYNMNRPNRAEYFWPAPGINGRPFPEQSVDYTELSSYIEVACCDRISLFFESPVRWVNPTLNDNTAGFGDLNAGVKLTLFQHECGVISGQFRSYMPTGIGERGLGTDHVSLEPALLFNHRAHEWLTVEGEVRYWLPISGSDFEGDIIRYGLGLVVGKQHQDCCCWFTPVAEFVGWIPLSGKQSYLDGNGLVVTESARGKNVVNGLFGARMGCYDRFDVYGGYGISLSGDRWYEETWRLEMRLKF